MNSNMFIQFDDVRFDFWCWNSQNGIEECKECIAFNRDTHFAFSAFHCPTKRFIGARKCLRIILDRHFVPIGFNQLKKKKTRAKVKSSCRKIYSMFTRRGPHKTFSGGPHALAQTVCACQPSVASRPRARAFPPGWMGGGKSGFSRNNIIVERSFQVRSLTERFFFFSIIITRATGCPSISYHRNMIITWTIYYCARVLVPIFEWLFANFPGADGPRSWSTHGRVS